MKYTFMSFNIQSCRNYMTRKFSTNQIANVIKLYNPDIIGLNEVRGEKFTATADESWFPQIKELSEKSGYKYYYHGVAIKLNGPYGNAILSKYPLKNIETISIPDPLIKDEKAFYESRCIIKAEIEDFTLLVTHVGLAKSEQLNALTTINLLLDNINTKVVLMGDFNMTPDDVNIKSLSNRLIDTSIYFKYKTLSFPSKNPVMKIDYIFTSKDIKVIDAYIPKIIASDHYPHIALLDI